MSESRYCELCETRREPTYAEMSARGLIELTPEQYFALADGVPMPQAGDDGDQAEGRDGR